MDVTIFSKLVSKLNHVSKRGPSCVIVGYVYSRLPPICVNQKRNRTVNWSCQIFHSGLLRFSWKWELNNISKFYGYSINVDVIKWEHFPRYWPFVRGIHRSPVDSPHTGQWRGALMFTLICARINGWVNNREAGDLRRHRAHYDVIVMNCYIGSSYTVFTWWHRHIGKVLKS